MQLRQHNGGVYLLCVLCSLLFPLQHISVWYFHKCFSSWIDSDSDPFFQMFGAVVVHLPLSRQTQHNEGKAEFWCCSGKQQQAGYCLALPWVVLHILLSNTHCACVPFLCYIAAVCPPSRHNNQLRNTITRRYLLNCSFRAFTHPLLGSADALSCSTWTHGLHQCLSDAALTIKA